MQPEAPDRRADMPGRRERDNMMSATETLLAIQETRHLLRNEITVVAANVETMRLDSTREHAEVKAAIDLARQERGQENAVLHEKIDQIPVIQASLQALHDEGIREETRRKDRRRFWSAVGVVSGVVFAGVGAYEVIVRLAGG